MGKYLIVTAFLFFTNVSPKSKEPMQITYNENRLQEIHKEIIEKEMILYESYK